MCGIAGFYNAKVGHDQVLRLIDKLRHRGPDGQRFYWHEDVGLIHTRLSIIELSDRGSQPYRFENLVLVFNGELYNYREVRETLKTKGYSFQSNSDTEVLIKAFHCWREDCIHHFIGMFAFSIYDETRDEMFLFRDRVGVKPLYYCYQNSALFFASELKAMSEFQIDKDMNSDAVSLYFRFGFVPDHLSIYKAVSKLEPAHYVKVSREGILKKRYWHVHYDPIQNKKEEDWLNELEDLLISSFQYRMVSDVPVGIFLSGGIDSSLLTAILQKHSGGVHCFTIGFEETGFDESIYARKVAEQLKVKHTQKILKLEEARSLFDQFYSIYDEPFADTSGIPTACVTQLAKDAGMKVVLSADGGDELFGGYTHYQKANDLFNRFRALPEGLRHAVAKSTRTLFPAAFRRKIAFNNLEHKAYALEEILEAKNPVAFFEAFLANQSPEEIINLVHAAGSTSMKFSPKIKEPMQSMMGWDFQYYLPDDLLVKVDRATMFYGIESREPFLDHRLVEFAASMPVELKMKDGGGKYPLRALLSRYVSRDYFERKKQGFSIPIFAWFSQELDALFETYLSTEYLNRAGILNTEEVHKEYHKYLLYKKNGKQYNIEKMWRILSFMLWWEKYNSA